MISVITGEILNSRKRDPNLWFELLKSELNLLVESLSHWEISGGNSFQLRVDDPQKALLAAIKIKAAIKTVKTLDVRLAIGIGDITHQSEKITQCNGSAFIYSGESFDLLKNEKQKLGVKSSWPVFDTIINLSLKLSSIVTDKWSVSAAEVVRLSLAHPQTRQSELGKMLGNIRQNAVSSRLSRAHLDELIELNELYTNMLIVLLK